MEKFSQYRDKGMTATQPSVQNEEGLIDLSRIWHCPILADTYQALWHLPTLPYLPLLLSRASVAVLLHNIFLLPTMATYRSPQQESFSLLYIRCSGNLVD